MSLKKLFGNRLRELRKQKGLTQEQLAELCDMQTNSIGMIETGHRAVSFSAIEKLATNLEVDYMELFNFYNIYNAEYTANKLYNTLCKLTKNFDNSTMLHLIEYTKLLKKFK